MACGSHAKLDDAVSARTTCKFLHKRCSLFKLFYKLIHSVSFKIKLVTVNNVNVVLLGSFCWLAKSRRCSNTRGPFYSRISYVWRNVGGEGRRAGIRDKRQVCCLHVACNEFALGFYEVPITVGLIRICGLLFIYTCCYVREPGRVSFGNLIRECALPHDKHWSFSSVLPLPGEPNCWPISLPYDE